MFSFPISRPDNMAAAAQVFALQRERERERGEEKKKSETKQERQRDLISFGSKPSS